MTETTSTTTGTNHRDIGRRQILTCGATALGAITLGLAHGLSQGAVSGTELSHNADAIHMEPVFKARPERVYATLTRTAEFDKVVKASAAMSADVAPNAKPTMVGAEAGGALALFGGFVTGRVLEMVANQRIVQAWRSEGWKAGDFSIVRFVLVPDGAGTKILFDHTGFPTADAGSLVTGWHVNYWEPLAKVLASQV
jgi:activator of HSP90 ATPase